MRPDIHSVFKVSHGEWNHGASFFFEADNHGEKEVNDEDCLIEEKISCGSDDGDGAIGLDAVGACRDRHAR